MPPDLSFVPVDHDPFADDSAPSLTMQGPMGERSPLQGGNIVPSQDLGPGVVSAVPGVNMGELRERYRQIMQEGHKLPSPLDMAIGLGGGPGGSPLAMVAGPAAKTMRELSEAFTARGVRNYIADRPTRNQYQLSDLVVPKEQQGQGLGSEFMSNLTGIADAEGKTLTLTASADKALGTTSLSRLKDFYKRFGFVENKGRNKDFTISDSMYRKPAPQKNVGTSAQEPTGSPLPMDETSRMARAAEQGYTIDAYKGMYPYDWRTVPERYGSGKIVPGTENRIPQEITSIDAYQTRGSDATGAGFFSSDPAVASRFGEVMGEGAVYPVKLRMQNPKVIDAQGKFAADFQFGKGAGQLELPPEPIKNGEDKKLPHAVVGYVQTSPHVGKYCGVCSMFEVEGPHCTLVIDPVRAGGYCRRFSKGKPHGS